MSSQLQEDHFQSLEMMQYGFTDLSAQNAKLWEQNQHLQEQLSQIQAKLEKNSQILEKKLEEEPLLEERREHRRKQRKFPKRDPLTKEKYEFLISETRKLSYTNFYRRVRLRLTLALLLLTGIRISELLPLQMNQVETLFTKYWIAIDRVKRGLASHKAFLTGEGVEILRERKADFRQPKTKILLSLPQKIVTSPYNEKPGIE